MRLFILVSGLSLAFAVSACNDDSDLKNAQDQRHADLKKSLEWTRNARLTPADSCTHAEEVLKASVRQDMELALAQQLQCALPGSDCYDHNGIIVDDMALPPSAPEADGDRPDDVSDTNVQVQGVDEADLVKTDGEDIIGIFDQYVVAARAWPPENLRELAHIRIPGSPQGLYLEGDQIVVLSRLYGKPYSYNYHDDFDIAPDAEEPSPPPEDIGYDMYGWPLDGTLLTLIDRKDNTLTIRKQQFFEGAQIDSRRIDNHLYLALTHPRPTPNLSYAVNIDVYNASERAIRRAYDRLREKNLRAIDDLTLDWWVPQSYDFHADTGIDLESQTALTDCTHLYTANNYSGAQNLVSIVTYDLQDDNLSASTIQGDWGTVYASPHAFYLASTNWQWNGWWGPADTQIPETLTQIHKFAFEDRGAAHYAASGAVQGYPLNQFAFDEYQDHLRVATTLGNFGWNNPNTSESHVHILSDTLVSLETVGRVEQLGVGESIYAVRFMGDKGYVVTFRQIDPLYVLDLSNPTAPFAAGELEIPGYSTYMHPIEDGHLLTIGRDADLNGRVGGLKLEIFNVQDPTTPRSVTTHVLGNDWGVDSEATYDHKAFLYFPARQLLAIPVAGWLETRPGTMEYQSALHVFHIEPTAIEPIGTIHHETLFQDEATATECYDWRYQNDTNVRRGVFMDDILFSISNAGILSHDTRAIDDGPISGFIANPRISSALEGARDRCIE